MSHPTASWTLVETVAGTTAVAIGTSFTPGEDFLLTDDGDIDLSTGDIRFITGLAAIAQSIWIVLQMFKGEWFLNRSIGIPYLANDVVTESESLLGQKFSELRARAAFRTAIMSVDGVESLTMAIAFDNAIRKMTLSFEAKTVAGTIIATEEI